MEHEQKILPHKTFWLFDIIDFAEANTLDKGVVGSLKLEKLNVKVREELRKNDFYLEEWNLIRNFRGPTEPGLSRMLDKYQKLDLMELQEFENRTIKHILTGKGRNFKRGVERYASKINPLFLELKDSVNNMLLKEINKSGKELVETSNEIKEMKKEVLGKRLS